MTNLDYQMLRDRILDFIVESCPALLLDEVLTEAFLKLVCREVRKAIREERAEMMERVRTPSVQ